jgi:DNA-binding response OmpR family regulator
VFYPSRTTVLFSSGYSAEVLKLHPEQGEDCELINKPFHPQEWLNRIARILARPR